MDTSSNLLDSNSARFSEQINSSSLLPQARYPESPLLPQLRDDSSDKHGMEQVPIEKRATSPEILPSVLESMNQVENEKEVASEPVLVRAENERAPIRGRRRLLGLGLLVLAVLIVLAIGLGVGLGVGLNTNHNRPAAVQATNSTSAVSSEYLIGGSINETFYTNSGVFNGTGIALASQSFTNDLQAGTQGNVDMYFQYFDGDIRWVQLSPEGNWLGGSVAETVTSSARNNTPLSAVSYSSNGSSTWHVFYIDANNYIKQITNSNTTNIWVDGPLNDMKLKANDQEQVGLQACWRGNDYGGPAYAHTPLPPSTPSSRFSNQVGMDLWYARDNTTFEQYSWQEGDSSWTYETEWSNKSGHAGMACYSWGRGTVTYAMFVNIENSVEVWWRDFNTTGANTTRHPTGIWSKTNISIPGVNPTSSLGYTNYFYAQLADNTIRGYNISWAAENTTLNGDPFSVDDSPGISGTHMSVTAIPSIGGGNSILVFYQTVGNGITEYVRDLIAGQWTSNNIPIPGN